MLDTNQKLNTTKTRLEEELNQTKTQLTDAVSELTNTKAELNQAKSQIADAQAHITTLESKICFICSYRETHFHAVCIIEKFNSEYKNPFSQQKKMKIALY